MAKASKMNPGTVGEKVKKDVQVWEGHMGTKKSMLVTLTPEDHNKVGRPTIEKAFEYQNKCVCSGDLVLAQDERGEYWTPSSNVDSGLLDPFRVYNQR